jgi:putative DNA methylase
VKKKLIEVALPLDKINAASAKEKSIRHGHPSTLHLWWARRPLAACRAVLFSSLVDDPSAHPDKFPDEASQQVERDRLFKILEDLVLWENSNNEEVLNRARQEILRSTDGNPPPVYDPFCGGGSIPLEAQRLGLEAHASDLNPVAVLITKAMIEIPPKFAGQPPVNPESRRKEGLATWRGARGLAEDVRYYGNWMRDRARERIGHLYPKLKLPKEYGGGEATVIAWLWARTVKCPNPACGIRMPLLRSFELSKKKGKAAWIEPVVDRDRCEVRFEVRTGKGQAPEGTVGRRGARCVACGEPSTLDYIRAEGRTGRMSPQMTAIVVEGVSGRIYLPPTSEHLQVAESAKPDWAPEAELPKNPRDFKTPNYGMRTFASLFTPRQLVALTSFSDLVSDARQKIVGDGGSSLYADAVATYLALGVSKLADAATTLTRWKPSMDQAIATFARQALPMVWDHAESNVFNGAAGDYYTTLNNMCRVLDAWDRRVSGSVHQIDACTIGQTSPVVFSTDPPYYDNIGYADLSDFFYVWLRRTLNSIYPDLFRTVLVPKKEELVATPYRFEGGIEEARTFFERGFGEAFSRMRSAHHPDYPLTVYYAFKQAESEEEDGDDDSPAVASTGWETMLEGLINAGFQINGTWPMRSELSNRMIASGNNALASSIVLACRPRLADAPNKAETDFQQELRRELPRALRTMQLESIAPVDLAQAAIGPGMAIYSKYSKVIGANGQRIPVRRALETINRVLDAVLSEQEGEFDRDTRFALAWFQEYGFGAGDFGRADVLSRALNVGVNGLGDAGILREGGGKVQLLNISELPEDWDPETDSRLTVWEITHHLIRLVYAGKNPAAARVIARVGSDAEKARDLAYRLYQICERKKWSQEAQPYNALVIEWPSLTTAARNIDEREPEQLTLAQS